MTQTRSSQRGFTLLEILIAFVVLALVGGALMQLFQGGLQNLSAAGGYTRAALLAETTLSELRAETTINPGERSSDLGQGYRYEMVLTPYLEDGVALPGLLQADLTIHWGIAPDDRQYSLRTLLLPPGTAQ